MRHETVLWAHHRTLRGLYKYSPRCGPEELIISETLLEPPYSSTVGLHDFELSTTFSLSTRFLNPKPEALVARGRLGSTGFGEVGRLVESTCINHSLANAAAADKRSLGFTAIRCLTNSIPSSGTP